MAPALRTLFLIAFLLSLIVPGGSFTSYARDPGSFPGGEPVASGINDRALAHVVDRVKASHSDALVIMKNGKPVVTWYSGNKAEPIETMSITKSLVALAIGCLIDRGRIRSIDEPVYRFFPEWDKGKKRLVTLRHLLNHTSGLEDVTQLSRKMPSNADFVRLALSSKLVSDPGTRFRYNNSAVNLLSGVVKVASGIRLDIFVRNEIFTPLGIGNVTWKVDEGGNALGMIGLTMAAPDLARIGQMMLQGGVWNGRPIVSETWIAEMTRQAQKFEPDSGLLWWILPEEPKASERQDPRVDRPRRSGQEGPVPHVPIQSKSPAGESGPSSENRLSAGYYARGHLGQYLIVIPAHHLIAVRQVRQSTRDAGDLSAFPGLVQDLVKQY
jgi:CubicO group peptidase (beta-lactamase class C family)